jgi:hypothetical protein
VAQGATRLAGRGAAAGSRKVPSEYAHIGTGKGGGRWANRLTATTVRGGDAASRILPRRQRLRGKTTQCFSPDESGCPGPRCAGPPPGERLSEHCCRGGLWLPPPARRFLSSGRTCGPIPWSGPSPHSNTRSPPESQGQILGGRFPIPGPWAMGRTGWSTVVPGARRAGLSACGNRAGRDPNPAIEPRSRRSVDNRYPIGEAKREVEQELPRVCSRVRSGTLPAPPRAAGSDR